MPIALLKRTTVGKKTSRSLVKECLHEVAGRTLPLRIVENDRARQLTLRIDAGGRGLRVTIPPGLAPGEVNRFLRRQQDWLEERLAKLPKRPLVRPGIRIPLRGVPHVIVHLPERRGTVSVGRKEDGTPALFVHGEREHLPRRLADFLKKQAKRDIEALVLKHTGAINKRAKSVRFRDTSSRWGSCTSDGVLSFSWRIMMAPIINYLVARGRASQADEPRAKFWKLCEELCPDTERCKDWLKRNGNALQAIQFE